MKTNRKAQFFTPLIVVFYIIAIVFAFVTITTSLSDVKDQPLAAIGDKQAAVFQAVQEANGKRIDVRQVARNAHDPALYDAGQNGFLENSECGMYADMNLWNDKDKSCYPSIENITLFYDKIAQPGVQRYLPDARVITTLSGNSIVASLGAKATAQIMGVATTYKYYVGGGLGYPLSNPKVTSCFPDQGSTEYPGIKLKATDNKVHAAESGEVQYLANDKIAILHPPLRVGPLEYALMTEYSPVKPTNGLKENDHVNSGQMIGELIGPELTFSVMDAEAQLNREYEETLGDASREYEGRHGYVNPYCYFVDAPEMDSTCDPSQYCDAVRIPSQPQLSQSTVYDKAGSLGSLAPTFDETYNIRTTVYYTVLFEDIAKRFSGKTLEQKWFQGFTDDVMKQYVKNPASPTSVECKDRPNYCCIPESKRGFYEEVKCQGSGMYDGKLYQSANIGTTLASSTPTSGYSTGKTGYGGAAEVGKSIAVNIDENSPCYIKPLSTVCIQFPYSTTWSRCYLAEDTGSAFKGRCKIDIYAGIGINEKEKASATGADNAGKGGPLVWVFIPGTDTSKIRQTGSPAGYVSLPSSFAIPLGFDQNILNNLVSWAQTTVNECDDKPEECLTDKITKSDYNSKLSCNEKIDVLRQIAARVNDCKALDDNECGCNLDIASKIPEGSRFSADKGEFRIGLITNPDSVKYDYDWDVNFAETKESQKTKLESWTYGILDESFMGSTEKWAKLDTPQVPQTQVLDRAAPWSKITIYKDDEGLTILNDNTGVRPCAEPFYRKAACYDTGKNIVLDTMEPNPVATSPDAFTPRVYVEKNMMIRFALTLIDTTKPDAIRPVIVWSDGTTALITWEAPEQTTNVTVYGNDEQVTTTEGLHPLQIDYFWVSSYGSAYCDTACHSTYSLSEGAAGLQSIGGAREALVYELEPGKGIIGPEGGAAMISLPSIPYFVSVNIADQAGNKATNFNGAMVMPMMQ
ncbi:MAG: 3D domain-containing protein [Candidatus Woesearchaeota archaeon]